VDGGDSTVARELRRFRQRLVADAAQHPPLARRRAGEGDPARLPDLLVAELDSLLPGSRNQLVVERIAVGAVPGGLPLHTTAEVRAGYVLRHDSLGPGGSPRDLVLTFPLTTVGQDSLVAVKMRYPFDELTAELHRARRRSLLWLSGLLAVGGAGATLVAIQFTRPIRSLRTSFERVEAGDLAARAAVTRNDEIGALTHSFNDMVERLQHTRAVEQRLAEAERLAAVGQLAAGVAHEVRNPLNAILLTIGQMQDRVGRSMAQGDRSAFDAYAATVTGEIVRLEKLVSSFLDLARSGTLELGSVDASASLQDSVALFASDAARRGVTLTLDAPGPLPIAADPSRLPTVWNNLLSNALAASRPGGHIRVRAVSEAPQDVGSPSTLRVEFEDNGAGIAPEQLERVFEPFTSGRPDGTGLGLSIVRSTVERHGGRVALTSQVGQGTKVSVWLPAQRPRAEEGTPR
jgi:signal transduction histidine kinase